MKELLILAVMLIVTLILMIGMVFTSGKSDGYIEGQLDCQNGIVKKYEKIYENTRYREVK